jgi:hypothetical protein
MESIVWQNAMIAVSFVACAIGLVLVLGFRHAPADEYERVDEALFAMIFAYWMVYCASVAIVHFGWLEGEFVIRSLRATSVLAYLLTWASVLSLPLHRLSASREIE